MTIPKINKYQKQILFYLYQFRYLTIKQLQRIFNHKDPHRIKVWLSDLKEKKLISVIEDKTNPTIPFIFCLATKARYILQEDEDCDKTFLGRLYKEKKFSDIFRRHCLFIVEIYLYFITHKEKDQTIEFFTAQELKAYDYFPKDLPDAYISVESKEGTDRYFLDLFDDYKKAPFLPRKRIRDYITYSEDGEWSASTDKALLPTILFVLANEKVKKHIQYYGKAKLEKTFEDISLFLTTQEDIKLGKEDLWEEVE